MIQTPSDQVVYALQRTLGAGDPLEALRALTELRAQIDQYEYARARRALEEGASFGQIGRALGISRQAAHRRYRAPARPRTVVSEGVRALLRAARDEAMHAGADTIECEHVALALAATGEIQTRHIDLEAARALITVTRATPPPTTLGRRLRTLLARHGGPVDVELLKRILPEDPDAVRVLKRLNP